MKSIRVNIKPLSINQAWAGRRFKTPQYKQYEKKLLFILPKYEVPKGQIRIDYIVGYSNMQSDIDNFLKSFQDILQKKYGFNDNMIYHIQIIKQIVKKGSEFINFEISELN